MFFQQLRQYVHRFKRLVWNLNLFESAPPTTSQHQLINQLISTRLFIVTFLLIIAILLSFLSSITIDKTFIKRKPTLQEYQQLYHKHQQTLTCPCTHLSIELSVFIHINFKLHQICSSDFVNPEWIAYLLRARRESVALWSRDFRSTSFYTFQSLASLCQDANDTIVNNFKRFYADQYVSMILTPASLLKTQLHAQIDQFRLSIVGEFLSSSRIIRGTLHGNALLSTLMTNALLRLNYATGGIYVVQAIYPPDCSCVASSWCSVRSRFFDGLTSNILFLVPGMYTGCFLVESLLQSTLECFYSDTCFSQLTGFISTTILSNATILNATTPSRYLPTTTVGDIVDQLMLETWNWTMMYDKYYAECEPYECRYTIKTRNDVVYIVTTMIGLIGGLVTVLKIVVPHLVSFTRRKRTFQRTGPYGHSIQQSVQIGLKYFQKLNLFESAPPTNDQQKLTNQLISTRLFIVTFLLIIAILLSFLSSITIDKTFTKKKPTLQEYQQLYEEHGQIITCPCTHVSIEHWIFLQIEYTLHQVCSSDFVGPTWIDYLEQTNGANDTMSRHDFRSTSQHAFRALQSLCRDTTETISNSLNRFYSDQYVTMLLTPSSLLESQIQSSIDQFRRSLISEYLSSLRIVRSMIQTNSLWSSLSTNAFLSYWVDRDTLYMTTYRYGTCYCSINSWCYEASIIYDSLDTNIVFVIPGMSVGCFVVEALLQSTLECFYSDTCFSQLTGFISTTILSNATILNATTPSRYLPTTTVGDIVDQLMLETWNWTMMYDKYYVECEPYECRYTIKTRNDIIYIITTLIGLMGGLITALKILVPRTVQIVTFVQRRRRIVAIVVVKKENAIEKSPHPIAREEDIDL